MNSQIDWKLIMGLIAILLSVFVIIYGNNLCQQTSPPPWTVPLLTKICPKPTPTSSPPVSTRESHIVLPLCNCEKTVVTDEPVIVRVRWGAKSRELAEQGANLVIYRLTVDGTSIQDLGEYRKPAVFVAGPAPISGENDLWWVYWDYPLDATTVGVRIVEADAIATADIYDGLTVTPAGTVFTSQVKLNVVSPSNP